MKVGDKIKFAFGSGQKEGVVHKLYDNTVYLKVDFKNDPGKIVKRKVSQVGGSKAKKAKKAKK